MPRIAHLLGLLLITPLSGAMASLGPAPAGALADRPALHAHRLAPTEVVDAPTAFQPPVPEGSTWGQLQVDGGTVRYARPEGPIRAMVLFFHGTGGSSAVVRSTEVRDVLLRMVDRGLMVVAPDSTARGAGAQWQAEGPFEDNPDVHRIRTIRQALVRRGLVAADTPAFFMGYSNGGKFAGYLGHVALREGWPLRGLVYHQARGRSGTFGAPVPLPSLWLGATLDAKVDPDGVALEAMVHDKKGFHGRLLLHRPLPLDPGRFTREPELTAEHARIAGETLRRCGLYDGLGELAVPARDILPTLDRCLAAAPAELRRPVRRQILVSLGTHSFSAEHAQAEVDFVIDHLEAHEARRRDDAD